MLNILKYALVVFVERNCWTNSRGLHEIRLDVEYQLRRAVPFSATIFFDSKDVHFFFFSLLTTEMGKILLLLQVAVQQERDRLAAP